MRLIQKLVVASLLFTLALAGCALDGDGVDTPHVQISTSDELATYLATAQGSPLDRLSPGARARFLDSLVFGRNGLGGFEYADLEAELTPSRIHAVLSLFGVERTTPMLSGARIETGKDRDLMLQLVEEGDHKGYKCESHATCAEMPKRICLSGC